MKVPARKEPETVVLEQMAQRLAAQRRERLTTAHLLAAIASRSGTGAELLLERKLDAELLLQAARTSIDDAERPIARALQRAREIAARMGAVDAQGVHVLLALLSDRGTAGHRVLDQCGVDANRLRVAAMNVGLGMVGRRPLVTRRELAVSAAPTTSPRARGTTVPVVPLPKVGQRPSSPSREGAGATASPGDAASPTPVETPPRAGAAVTEPGGARSEERGVARDTPVEADLPARHVLDVEESPHAAQGRKRRRVAPSGGKTSSARFELSRKDFPALCGFGKNLSLQAARGELEPVVGRDREVEQVLDVLAKRRGNNPALVGAAGVGKTSVVRALASRVASGEGLGSLDDRIIVEIPLTDLLAGTGVRGALAERFAAIRKEVLAAKGRVVLFFDEIHQLFGSDGVEEIVADLKVALARGELPCIGATTWEEYRRHIETDAALARRFSAVEVEEPSAEDAFEILEVLAGDLEAHHGLRYAPEALAAAVSWSVRYVPGRALPDKAISIVDLAGARARRRAAPSVTVESVAEVVAEMASLPIERLLETDAERMLRFEELLAERVVGHAAAAARIARILRRNAAGLGSSRPIGSFLLLGPTGVGKTETAKAIAEVLFSSDGALTRVDLSEYSEPHSIARLLGAPPGYVGHDAGGQLTEAVRRRPYQVLLLDELEKAHTEVLQAFLGVFDEGRLTDGKGRTVDFTNTVIVMTSNLGAAEVASGGRRRVGFGAASGSGRSDLETRIAAAARAALPPELYNRIDEVLVFAPLARDEVAEIARRLLDRLAVTLAVERGVRLEFEPELVECLLDRGGFDPELGARPLKRALARQVEVPLAEGLLAGTLSEGDTVRVGVEAGQVRVSVQGRPDVGGSGQAGPDDGGLSEGGPDEGYVADTPRVDADGVGGGLASERRPQAAE